MFALLAPAARLVVSARVCGSAQPGRLLVIWLVVRTTIWSVGITAAFTNPPLDLIEWASWGNSLEWGYPKHPPLPAWLAAFALSLTPDGVGGIYFFSYLLSSTCLGAAWVLARRFLTPWTALVSVLALDGLAYLTNDPAEYSNNVTLNVAWAWLLVAVHRAIHGGGIAWWLAVGVAAGLGALCKYTIGLPLLAAAAYAVLTPDGRRQFRTPGPYLAAVVAAGLFAPHFVWLLRHDFITLTYATERTADPRLLARLKNPAVFMLGQAALLLPVGFILWPMRRSRTGERSDARFLHIVVFGPVFLLVVMSAVTGCQLRTIWGAPLWIFAGVWAMVAFRCDATPDAFRAAVRRWAVVAGVMFAIALTRPALDPFVTKDMGRSAFPGKQLTDELTDRWGKLYPTPFPIVGGEGWTAGNVCVFAAHRPILYSNGAHGYLAMDPKHCPWTNDADLNHRGGVILWYADQLGDPPPPVLLARFPKVIAQPPIVLHGRTPAAVPPLRVGVAFVPPE